MRIITLVTVLFLATASVAEPAVYDPTGETPEIKLNHNRHTTVIHLDTFDHTDVQRIEVWRFNDTTQDGEWTQLAVVPPGTDNFVDNQRQNQSTTSYGVMVVFTDGTFTRNAGDDNGDWPRCDWLFVDVPPHIREWCLMPPPHIEDSDSTEVS